MPLTRNEPNDVPSTRKAKPIRENCILPCERIGSSLVNESSAVRKNEYWQVQVRQGSIKDKGALP